MLKDAWETVRSYIDERLSSPLLTGFAVAWGVINYRFFLIVFSNERFTEKVTLINTFVFTSVEEKLWKGFLLPLFVALVYVLVYPFIDRLIFAVWRWHQHKLLVLRQRIDEERPLSEKDKSQLLMRLHEAERLQAEERRRFEEIIEIQQEKIRLLDARDKAVEGAGQDDVSKIELGRDGSESAFSKDRPLTVATTAAEFLLRTSSNSKLLSTPLSFESLKVWLERKYPGKPVGDEVLKKILNDVDVSKYGTVRDVSEAVARASNAVELFESEMPELFTKSADYVSKSLGFVDLEFRKRHGFSGESRAMLERLDEYVFVPKSAEENVKDKDSISELEVKILNAIAEIEEDGSRAYENPIAARSGLAKLKVRFGLGELKSRNFIFEGHDEDGDPFYILQHEGRRALINSAEK